MEAVAVVDEAAQGSSTVPSPYGDMLEYYCAMRHLDFHRFSAPADMRIPVVAEDMLMRFFDDGQLTAHVGAPRSYRDGGVLSASEDAMAALPETTVGEGEERSECAVCLEAYQAGDEMRILPCSHGFHGRCIFRWLRVSRLCPLCQFALPAAAEETESFLGEEDGSNGNGQEEHSAYDL